MNKTQKNTIRGIVTTLAAALLLLTLLSSCQKEKDDLVALLALTAIGQSQPQPAFVFSGGSGGSENIYTVNADGSNLQQLTFSNLGDRFPEWSPDGTRIVFGSSNRDGIWIMNSDGSNLQQLTTVADESHPTFTPDGQRIAFQTRDRYHSSPDIAIMNTDGSNVTRLTNNTDWDQMPDVSPDGSRIVFYTSRDGDTEVYTIAINGSDAQRVTNKVGTHANAIYSMDGSRIFYTESGNGVFWSKPDGSDEVKIADSGTNGLSQCIEGILYMGGMQSVDISSKTTTAFPGDLPISFRYANCHFPR